MARLKIYNAATATWEYLSSLLRANPYKFRAKKATADGNQTLTNTTYTDVTFPTVVFDPNGNFASGQYTVPVDGYYYISATVQLGGTTMTVGASKLFADAVEIDGIYFQGTAGTASCSGIYYFTAGQVIKVQAYVAAASGWNVAAGNRTSFSGYLVGY